MKIFRKSICALSALAISTGAAVAGGFSTEGVNPGGALFNDKSLVVQGALGYVMPKRRYKNGVGTTGFGGLPGPPVGLVYPGTTSSSDAANNYLLLSGDLKFRVNQEIDCALRVHEPYAIDQEVSPNYAGRFYRTSQLIESVGIDGTCSYKFAIDDRSRVRILAGVRSTDLKYDRTNDLLFGALLTPAGLLVADGSNNYDAKGDRGYGYRIGASYEIPEIALRAQIIYDSAIDLDASGTQTLIIAANPLRPAGTTVLPITASVEMPQSISARFQTGVNETTLVYAGVRWMDWSVLKTLNVIGGLAGPGGVTTLDNGYSDGWTFDTGVQKKLTEQLSASLGFKWNSGIGGGYTDTWGLSAGVAYDLDDNWRLSFGGGATLLTSSNEFNTLSSTGATTFHKQPNDWAFTLGTRLQYAID
ncbi:MAG: OmpP1/FadL family transporter [Rhizobiaceae bacterium]